ncbi:MAG TPA: isoprenoid biosynthesis glyoxalase ElbB [Phycisphaerales bacterium]|nr:isoprenoid biosynthesis glyoxalase ElbB [Phycisphaerales bacterium]
MAKVALVLSGCGFLDGAEITESVSCLVHLSRLGATVRCFAPDKPQADVVDHRAGKPLPGQARNVLTESARIARGAIEPLGALDPDDFDAVVFPGGYGAAKNLCDFASAGARCTVDPEVKRVLTRFHQAGKPIGLCCIAPMLVARVLGVRAGGPGVCVTAGCDPGVAEAVAAMGSTHVDKPVDEAHVDEAHNVVTAPAYMYGEATPHDVFRGIGEMIEQVVGRAARDGGAARTTAGRAG